MSRALIEITRDLITAKEDYNIFDNEHAIEQIDDLIKERAQKENGIQYLYGEMDGEVTMFSKQIDRMKAYVKFLKNSQERIKSYVIESYESTGELPKHDIFNPIKIAKSAGAVDVIDESKIPSYYWVEVVTKRLDKKRLLVDLKNGNNIPGVRLMKNKYVKGVK
tara:strand:+ start:1965 stop:2456 length:492 start_codon:yes stop_codon:yes gene_type:complete